MVALSRKVRSTPQPACRCQGDDRLVLRLAGSRQDLEQAFALVRRSYVEVGLQAEDGQNIRVTKYHVLPTSKVFIAVRPEASAGRDSVAPPHVTGTITVVQDGCLGLPCEDVAREHLIPLRAGGARMAEFIALASDKSETSSRTALKLFRLAYEHCRLNGITHIVASLTERHIGFYRRMFGFKAVGTIKSYKMANGLPVQVHHLDVAEARNLIEARAQALFSESAWRQFWEQDSPAVLCEAARMSPWGAEWIDHFVARSHDLLDQLDAKTVDLLRREFMRFGRSFLCGPAGCCTHRGSGTGAPA